MYVYLHTKEWSPFRRLILGTVAHIGFAGNAEWEDNADEALPKIFDRVLIVTLREKE